MGISLDLSQNDIIIVLSKITFLSNINFVGFVCSYQIL
ncbi:hypothetical protein GGQ60_001346 [Pedobacter zeae]|uniref:Uncharacterized protein n=1 Tax=Pedobacter zeae TaxID=1737356 RepID=A0A7W6KAM4_9SPHI|nr:hypothetical protein [Pedobacter zeae]